MSLPLLRLKKNEDRRLRAGHLWIYSNEIDTTVSPLKSFTPGQIVLIEAADKKKLGVGYINPKSLITVRLLSENLSENIDTDFFIRRIQAALHIRERLYDKPYYRLVFGESDFLPGLVIDRFNSVFSVQLNTAGMQAQQENIIAALRTVIPDTTGILLKNDSSARQYEGLENEVVVGFGDVPEKVEVVENNCRFFTSLWEGQKTGWFYDHRLNRSQLYHYVKGQRILDVFSYLGAWGIQAAELGAHSVVCVDSSPLSAKWIPENAALNQLQDKVSVITDDAFDALKKLATANEQFSVIILDPPAFIKKQKDMKEGTLAYQRINELALKLLKPDGILISCSCSMHMEDAEFIQMLRRAGIHSHTRLQLLERGHQAHDHPMHLAIPETNYLKMAVVRKIGK